MLLRGIVPNQQRGRRGKNIRHARSRIRFSTQRRRQGREVRGAMMVDVVRLQYDSRELGEQIIFFVRSPRRTDHANRLATLHVTNGCKSFPDQFKRLFPGRRR
jgi:hypothetical protein